MRTQECIVCGISYSLTAEFFHRSNHTLSGFISKCKVCRRAECRAWHTDNPAKSKANRDYWAKENRNYLREINAKRHQALRLNALKAYSSQDIPACACCNESKLEFLVLDHINGGGREHRMALGTSAQYYKSLAKLDFPPGLRVLCHNCNASIGIYNYCPHKAVELVA